MTIETRARELHHRNMNGDAIPHAISPGPQIFCHHCERLRFGADFASNEEFAPCAYCRKRGVAPEDRNPPRDPRD